MRDLWQLVLNGLKLLLTMRVVAWSPPLMAALIVWWVVWWLRRRANAEVRHHPAVFLAQ